MNHNMSQINQILEKLSRIDYIKPGEIPNIELYMDQVTTFMDSHLAHSKRYEDDKILTKTMINNYAKNKLLPPPAKKKYTKDHMLLLIFIYYFKSFLSINDIQALLAPVCDRYFGGKDGISLEDVYEEVFSMKKEQLNALVQDVKQKFETADDTFENLPEEEREPMRMFSFICTLAFDVYVKKQIIESLIDEMAAGKNMQEK
ncbi:MAG: DUF1836 domain-containing protein [Lachnospiraceae bacterium]|nr:DUF1836 domain-containing protein [Lachnospiraceae bacterium]